MPSVPTHFETDSVEPFWSRFVDELRREAGAAHYETWLSRLGCKSHVDGCVELVSPNAFTKDWVQRHYAVMIGDAARKVDGEARNVRILDAGELPDGQFDDLARIGSFGAFRVAYERDAGSRDGAARDGGGETFDRRGATEDMQALLPEGGGEAAKDSGESIGPAPIELRDGNRLRDDVLRHDELERERGAGSGRREDQGETAEGAARVLPAGVAPAGNGAGSHGQAGYNEDSLGFFQQYSDFVLNPAFTFQNFVVGSCNELGCAAAKAVAEFPGGPYNPFFLHGASGLGKTHLLQAICQSVLRSSKVRRVLYVTCENFVNQFIEAVTNGELESFRYKYRNVDLLLIDDVQFLEGKTRTQEEFFHTFNTLYNGQRQIVMSSDRSPREIQTLQDRLVSRFRWGMVTNVETPCLETRVAILKRKARLRGHELAPEVAQCLAEHIDTNIRELEGAVTKVIGYANLMGRRIDLETVYEALRDLVPSRSQVSIQDVIDVVTKDYGVQARELQSRRRLKSVVLPRQIAIFLARRHTRLSLEEIGGFFGGRDHSTVLHSIKKIDRLTGDDTEMNERVGRLSTILARG